MNIRYICLCVISVMILITGTVSAAQIGDIAGELKISQWLTGEPVSIEKGKNIYVVEFWATWCPHCRDCIPILSEIQKKFGNKGVVVVGVTTEAREDVEPFVKGKKDEIAYAIGIDNAEQTYKAYMEAFGTDAIPNAFIVSRDGRILWFGHPADALEKALEEILAGTYDLEKAKKETLAKMRIEKAERLIPVYQHLTTNTDEEVLIKAVSSRILYYAKDNAGFLEAFAQLILMYPEISRWGKDTAMKSIKTAIELSKEQEPSILATYALALFEDGKLGEAIQYQKKAIALCGDEEKKAEYEERLKEYQNYQ